MAKTTDQQLDELRKAVEAAGRRALAAALIAAGSLIAAATDFVNNLF